MVEREDTMNEYGNNETAIQNGDYPVMGGNEDHPKKGDLVVDLSMMEKLDLTSLSLLLTAQQNAQEEDRAVWLAGVPMHVWQHLHGMGLGRFFKPFPVSGTVTV